MPRSTEILPLLAMAPGTERALTVHRWGSPGARPKAYLHAALHADELPGAMALHHLMPRLDRADAAGQIIGEVVVVPLANPIGIAQNLGGTNLGRYDWHSRENFNRNFVADWAAVAGRIGNRLDGRPDHDVPLVRQAAVELVADTAPRNEVDSLRRHLMRLAVDADLILDLHCAGSAILHLFVDEACWAVGGAELSAQVGSRATIFAGWTLASRTFSGTMGALWPQVSAALPGRPPLPQASLAAVVEYRSRVDVTDELGAADADNLYRVLQRRGVIAGDPGPLPAPLCDGVPASAMDVGYAPRTGMLVYHRREGDRVAAGEPVCSVIDPLAADQTAARTVVAAQADGLIFNTRPDRIVRPGAVVFRLVAKAPLAHRIGRPSLDD